MANTPYNPLDKTNIGRSVAEAMLARPIEVLLELQPFDGAGVYALYYVGQFPAYQALVDTNRDQSLQRPIYVGKAVPAGARKGGFGLGAEPGKVMYHRLKEHLDSVSRCENLDEKDFSCRYLVSDDIWIPLAEAVLIDLLNPVWNRLLDGFGNHDPGSGRSNQQRSAWDTLHPGREWANKLKLHSRTADEFIKLIEDFFRGKPVPTISTEKAVTEEE